MQIISEAINATVNTAKSIVGGVKLAKGKKELKTALENIQYTRPEEYSQIMDILGSREATIGSRQQAVENRVKETTGTGLTALRQGVGGSSDYVAGLLGLKERERQSIADIGIQFDEMRDQARLGKVEGLKLGAEYSDKEQYYNDLYKEMVRLNLAAGKMNAGENMLWGGLEGIAAGAESALGTYNMSQAFQNG